jgi:type II secretory pathway component GspD/PulD (secretin)
VTKSLRCAHRLVAILAGAIVLLGLAATAGTTAENERLITLDAEDAYLPSVLKILGEKGELNIVTGPGVTAERLSIHMKDVPIDQAVNLVVRAAGLAYERIGNSVLVADPRSLKEETGLSSYVVELKYADALEVQAALKKLAAEIEVDRGGNRLIVVTSPRVIAEIQSIVSRLDVPARQVMLEARIVEVSTDDAKKLGIDWDLLNRQSVVIVEGTPAPTKPDAFPDQLPFIRTPVRGDHISRQGKALQAAIDFLIKEGNARVLANPKIATLNGKEASMLIGSRIPFQVSGTTFVSGAAAQTTSIQKEEVGIKLRITPLINADGYITTEINPEVSSVSGFRGQNSDLPVVDTRQASTTVRLKDGNSVIIGGLLSESTTHDITKLPILGQIPGLGLLFQHHSITRLKKDLVIEVTPRIMPEQQ